jgi:predicted amino acid-binding ACT domain protein
MTTPLVLTFVGDDRPGLVNAISEKVQGEILNR